MICETASVWCSYYHLYETSGVDVVCKRKLRVSSAAPILNETSGSCVIMGVVLLFLEAAAENKE